MYVPTALAKIRRHPGRHTRQDACSCYSCYMLHLCPTCTLAAAPRCSLSHSP